MYYLTTNFAFNLPRALGMSSSRFLREAGVKIDYKH
jgi:hypothetical protein